MWQYSAVLVLYSILLLTASTEPAADTSDDSPLGHLRPFGTQGPVRDVDSVDGFMPPAEFLTNYAMQNRPLLFRGPAKAFPAFAKWTDAHLEMSTPPRPAGDVHIEHNKKENRSQQYSYVHFKEFLRTYNTTDIYMVSSVPRFLLGDLVLPFPLQCRFFVAGGLDSHLAWFSSGGTSSVIHYDTYENVNCLLRGRKTLVMLNTTRYREQVDKIIDKAHGGFSSADVDRIDVKARPEFSGLEFHSAEMRAGDCLYIPRLWVHQVRSFENNLAVNVWWFDRPFYNVTACAKKFVRNLSFSRVYFGEQLREAESDANAVRATLAAQLTLPASEVALLSLLTAGDPEGVSAAWPQFPPAVSALFRSLDADKDGALTGNELADKMKLKSAVTVMEAITEYNVQVFAMHEAAEATDPRGDVGKLPKLFKTMRGDEGVFATRRTWQAADAAAQTAQPDDGGEKIWKAEL